MFRLMRLWARPCRAEQIAIAIAAAAAFGAAPAVASADIVYCVPATSIAGCPSGATAKATIAAAMTAVNNDSTSAHDTIRIGPGTYPEGGIANTPGHQVDVVGAGATQTTIAPAAANSQTTISLGLPSTIEGVTVDVASGSFNTGLFDGGTATGVRIVAGTGSTDPTGVALDGTFASGTISVPDPGIGVASRGYGSAVIDDSSITAGTGFLGSGTLARTRIDANVDVTEGTDASGSAGSVTIDDSLLLARGGSGPETGISVSAQGGITSGEALTLMLRHDTLLGDGSSGSTGISCVVDANGFAQDPSSLCGDHRQLHRPRVLARALPQRVGRLAAHAGRVGERRRRLLRPRPVDRRRRRQPRGMGGFGSGQITLGANDVNVDPAFASTTPSAADAFELTRQSTLIDAGDPTLGTGESTTDLGGSARVVAGRPGAPAVSDVGAFEYQDRAPSVTASVSPKSVRVGKAVMFTAAASAIDPGDSITGVSWKFNDGTTASGTSVTHSFARAGTHTAVATATDANGYSIASAPVTVAVGPPAITKLTLKPKSFRASRAGGSVTRLSRRRRQSGTVVRYLDSVPARTTFTILRRVRRHRRALWARVGSFSRQDAAGVNSFRFTGRLAGRKLAPGSYRMSVTPRAAGAAGLAVVSGFVVLAR